MISLRSSTVVELPSSACNRHTNVLHDSRLAISHDGNVTSTCPGFELPSQQLFQIMRTARWDEASKHLPHILTCLTWSDYSLAWMPTPGSSFYCSTVHRLARRRPLLKKSETERLKGVLFQTSFASAKQKRRYKRRYHC